MYNPVYSHYLEIRYRVFYIIYAIICAFITSYYYQLELMYLISRPFIQLNQTLQSTDIAEALATTFRLCIYISLGICILNYIYQYWSFLVPSRYVFERKKISKFIVILLIILCLETYFIYFNIFPKICEVFSSFQIYLDSPVNSISSTVDINKANNGLNESFNNNYNKNILKIIEMSPRIESTVTSTMQIYFLLCLLFQIPVLFILLFYLDYCNSLSICRYRKVVFFIIICFSALISPPDLMSQFMCFLIISFFFELSLWIGCFFFVKKINKGLVTKSN